MASLNRVEIIGNLGADPETRAMPSGVAVANIRVATGEKWKDKQSGEMKERTEWHSVSLFGRLGEVAGEYLKKGSKVFIAGSLRTRKWQDKTGADRYTTEIIGNELIMLDGNNRGTMNPGRNERRDDTPDDPSTSAGGGDSGGSNKGGDSESDDDIPFAFANLAPLGGILFALAAAAQWSPMS